MSWLNICTSACVTLLCMVRVKTPSSRVLCLCSWHVRVEIPALWCVALPWTCASCSQEPCISVMSGTAEQHAQKHVPRSLQRSSARVYTMPLLISKSLLHRARNCLLAPREANQIKQSGKADSLFINLTRSPGDLRSRPEILLQLLLDASPVFACAPSLDHAGRYVPALCTLGRNQHRGYGFLHSTAFP